MKQLLRNFLVPLSNKRICRNSLTDINKLIYYLRIGHIVVIDSIYDMNSIKKNTKLVNFQFVSLD